MAVPSMSLAHLLIASNVAAFTIILRRKELFAFCEDKSCKEFFAFCEDKNNSKSPYMLPRRHNVHLLLYVPDG